MAFQSKLFLRLKLCDCAKEAVNTTTLVYNDLFFKLQVDFLQNTIFMIVPDRCLNKIVSLQIDGGRCLVENQDPGPPQQGPAHQEWISSRATCTFEPSILEWPNDGTQVRWIKFKQNQTFKVANLGLFSCLASIVSQKWISVWEVRIKDWPFKGRSDRLLY